jgi:hypothetical protein
MRQTFWKWKLYLFIRELDATQETITKFARIYAENGSGETLENEKKLIENVHRFSKTGALPATVYGTCLPVMDSMGEEFQAWIAANTFAHYALVANSKINGRADNELILTNFDVTPSGQIVTWDTVKNYLSSQFDLLEILEVEEI